MNVGSLHDQAVRLNARAARIAATLLADDPHFPANLRHALRMALSSAAQEELPAAVGSDDRDARAALDFVTACKKACAAQGGAG